MLSFTERQSSIVRSLEQNAVQAHVSIFILFLKTPKFPTVLHPHILILPMDTESSSRFYTMNTKNTSTIKGIFSKDKHYFFTEKMGLECVI